MGKWAETRFFFKNTVKMGEKGLFLGRFDAFFARFGAHFYLAKVGFCPLFFGHKPTFPKVSARIFAVKVGKSPVSKI